MKDYTDLTLSFNDLEKFKMTVECKRGLLQLLKQDIIIALPKLELIRIKELQSNINVAIDYFNDLLESPDKRYILDVKYIEIKQLLNYYEELASHIQTMLNMIVGG